MQTSHVLPHLGEEDEAGPWSEVGDSWGQGHCATKRPPLSSISVPQHNMVLGKSLSQESPSCLSRFGALSEGCDSLRACKCPPER